MIETLHITLLNPDAKSLLLDLEKLNIITINNQVKNNNIENEKLNVMADIKSALIEVQNIENGIQKATTIDDFLIELENEE